MSEFIVYLHEVFEPFGTIQSRKMFGGHGIYPDGLMSALVAEDELYLKVDKESVSLFNEQQLGPFEYTKGNRTMQMSYYRAPESMYEDPQSALLWARRAYDAALRSRQT